MVDNPLGSHPFGTAPFGPTPSAGQTTFIEFDAVAVAVGLTELVGEANLDIEALGAFVPIEEIEGEAALGFVADGVSAFSRPKVRVIATAPFSKRSVSSLSRPTIAASQHSGRGRTGLSHTGLN